MEVKKGELAKVVCRYQQYRAVGKIMNSGFAPGTHRLVLAGDLA